MKVDEGYIYDFCLDWQMNAISKKDLIEKFKRDHVDYFIFSKFAKTKNWFTSSMAILIDANDF